MGQTTEANNEKKIRRRKKTAEVNPYITRRTHTRTDTHTWTLDNPDGKMLQCLRTIKGNASRKFLWNALASSGLASPLPLSVIRWKAWTAATRHACRRMKPQLDSRMNEAEPWTPRVVGARLKGLRGTHRSRDGEGTLGVDTGSSYNRYGTAALGSRISCPECKHFISRRGANALSRNAHATWPTQQCVLRAILSGWGATTSSERVMHGLELHNTRAARLSLIGR